jgi:putative phosphoesterase
MRSILVFSDLHADKKALEDIIPALEKVDLSICCGDFLGYGKDIDYCMEYVLNNVDLVVQGNHERLAATNENLERQLPVIKESTLYTRDKLSSEQKEMLSSLPTEIWYEDMYVTHSIGDNYLRTRKDFMLLCARIPKDANYVFFGHTHEQVLLKYENRIIINPGSVTSGRRGFKRSYVLMNDGKIQFVNLENIS